MKRNKIKNTPEFLLESGLLFEINRKILHPFGLALEVDISDDDKKIVFGNIWDHRDDPEGLIYAEEAFNVGKEKIEKFMKEFGDERLKTRLGILGYTIQEDANDLHDTDPDIKTDVSNIIPEDD